MHTARLQRLLCTPTLQRHTGIDSRAEWHPKYPKSSSRKTRLVVVVESNHLGDSINYRDVTATPSNAFPFAFSFCLPFLPLRRLLGLFVLPTEFTDRHLSCHGMSLAVPISICEHTLFIRCRLSIGLTGCFLRIEGQNECTSNCLSNNACGLQGNF